MVLLEWEKDLNNKDEMPLRTPRKIENTSMPCHCFLSPGLGIHEHHLLETRDPWASSVRNHV